MKKVEYAELRGIFGITLPWEKEASAPIMKEERPSYSILPSGEDIFGSIAIEDEYRRITAENKIGLGKDSNWGVGWQEPWNITEVIDSSSIMNPIQKAKSEEGGFWDGLLGTIKKTTDTVASVYENVMKTKAASQNEINKLKLMYEGLQTSEGKTAAKELVKAEIPWIPIAVIGLALAGTILLVKK